MSTVIAKKLCWNCEGEVEAESENCRYCGVDLGGEAKASQEPASFEPAYKFAQSEQAAPAPEPAYRMNSGGAITDERWQEAINNEPGQQKMNQQVEGIKGWLSPLAMLLSGSVFLLFGLVLFLFSEDGVFTLRWNANFSLFYLVAAVPLLFYGWQALNRIKE